MRVSVQTAPFDPADELREFSANGGGAVVSFTGIVRDDTGDLQRLEIEQYEGMTTAALEMFMHQAAARFELQNALIIHRHGPLSVGEPIMMVAAAARHRKAAFAAADFLMDYLKSRAPFWKKEITATGERWVKAKAEDETALEGWGQ